MQIQTLTILTSAAVGVMSTAWGFFQMSPAINTPEVWSALPRNTIYGVIGAIVVAIFARWFKVNRLTAGSIVACAIAVVTSTVWPLLVTIWFGFASYVIGIGILFLLKIDRHKQSQITAFLIGAGTYGTIVGLFAHFPVNYPGLYGFMLAAPLVLGWRTANEAFSSLFSYLAQPSRSESKWLDLAIALIALIHFTVALMPEVGHDALAMHLFVPGHLATRQQWGFDVNTYVWAVMPMMGDWLFSIAYMLAGETAARLINVGFIFVLSWLIRDLVMWAGGNAVGARWAVLLFLTTPLTFTESSSLFIESVWASFAVAGSLSVFKLLQRDNNQSAHLPVAGFLLGGALAAKAITFTILPVLLLLLVIRFRTWMQRNLVVTISVGLLLFFVIGGIPYATAWHLTGNPVFPFFNQLFQSPFYPAVNFESASFFGKGLTWDVFFQATFHTEKFMESKPGASGFQWLLLFSPALFVLLFSAQHKGTLLFLVATLSVALSFQSVTYLRYVLPSFAWVAAGMGIALSAASTNFPFSKKVLPVAGWLVVFLNFFFLKSGTYYGDLSLQPLTSQSGREDYLNNRLPIRSVIELVNRLNVERTPVAVFSSPLTAGLNSNGLYPIWYNHQFQAQMSKTITPAHVAQLLLDKGVSFIILDSNWDSAEKRKLIEIATEVIAERGSISARKLKTSYKFQTELLKSPDFSSFDGWNLPVGLHEREAGRITVSVSSPASQLVSVVSGRRYKNSVTARCKDQSTQGRVQMNWLDLNANFISTDIQVFDCTQAESVHIMEISAPQGAVTAVVYASSHTSLPIIISMVSLKQ